MNLKTVLEQWQEYWAAVAPDGASAVQMIETRRAFYAGVFSAICTFRDIGTDAVTEDQGVAHMEALYRECVAFNERVRGGRA